MPHKGTTPKRMAARGQSAKLAKGPALKKSAPAKATPAKVKAKAAPEVQIQKAKAALKKESKTAVQAKAPAPALAKAPAAKMKTPPIKPAPMKAAPAAKVPAAVTAAAVKAKPVKGNAKPKVPDIAEMVAGKPEPKAKRGRKISIDINPNEAASALAGKWATLNKKAEQIEAKPYNMRNQFEEKTAITHKVLGWGYILANRNDRLEVLFKDGIKYLISNYKS